VLAVKLVEVEPEAKVTEAGMLRAVEEVESGTTVKAAGPLDNVTAQDVLLFEIKLDAEHLTDETTTAEISPIETVFDEPLIAAVIVAV